MPAATAATFRLSIAQNYLPNVESFYYMRLHGRNNAATLKHQLGLGVSGAYRDEMVTRYPELEGVVRTDPAATAPLLPAGGSPA